MAQKIPKWDLLEKYFPASDAAAVARLVGGKVEYNYKIGVFTNFCCIRVSRALNLAGQPVTYFRDTGSDGKMKPAVSSGRNKQWHVFRVRSLRKYLERRYGKGEPYTPANYASGLSGRRGIIVQEVPGWDDASGHADCWKDSGCLWRDYGKDAKHIFFWEAP